MSPEKMIELTLAGTKTDYSQELWSAFRNGFPIENLRPLLVSKNPEVTDLGAYLIYELGADVRCLLTDIVPLLDNADPQIRGSAVIALQECATKFDTTALGKVIELLDDPDPFVHRIVMRFIQYCEVGMLIAGVNEAAVTQKGTIFEQFPRIIGSFFSRRANQSSTGLADVIDRLLRHENPVANRLGVGLATRPRLVADENLIDLAECVAEEECRNIVKWARKRAPKVYAITMRL